MGKICTIICGAPCGKFPRELAEGFIIAADRGLDYALEAGISPDIAVGDFDSAKSAVPSGIETVKFPPEKDYSDAELAAKIALERGFDEIKLLCSLGGRLDHTIANIQLAYSLKKRGVSAELFGGGERAYVLENETREIPAFSGYLSVFAYEKSAVISESGVKYPTEKVEFTNEFPLGLSNEITEKSAKITVHSGAALIILVENGR
ncbi:MAG TPA: thiamine diphosphokinase [Ruminococcaceae bacterium]|nr:thiamine diphosphokinase [Oscillospiraceae bacterium]